MELVKSQLKGNSEIVKNFLRIDGLKNIQDLYLLSHNRLTLIRADGTVMFDSASDTEESHKYRAEIKEAFEKSEGFQVRYSTTVLDKQIYYSTLYDDDLVIRASASYSKIISKYPCDFKVLIDEVLDEMASIIGEKNPKIDIDLKLKSKDNYISVDKDKIKILLKNLIENALIYNNKEFVNLQIKVEESNEHLRISIKDNGIGIPEQELKNIFNRFYRVDKARTSNLGGTGLGLSLVNEIVELYSGAINVISKENEGSEFIVKILK